MPPSFANANFRLTLPKLVFIGDFLQVTFQFEYKNHNETETALYKIKFRETTRQKYEQIEKNLYFSSSQNRHNVKILFTNNLKRLTSKRLLLEITLVSSDGTYTTVVYNTPRFGDVSLNDVRILNSEKDTSVLFNKIKSKHSMPPREQRTTMTSSFSHNSVSAIPLSHANSTNHSYNAEDAYSAPTSPGLKPYLEALQQEKYYLMKEGGRKYKVSNGELISVEQDKYYYIFDMESELFIANDSPVSIHYEFIQTKGTVLACEDFQIIVELKCNIGEYIGTAFIAVEPWKLLDYMAVRIASLERTGNQKMLELLIDHGPSLATNQSINLIPKGQKEAIKKALIEPICIIWGPPGTGKTHTMAELALRFEKQHKTVLIVSHSNVSVDGVAKKIYELLQKKKRDQFLADGKVLRYGYVRDEELHNNPYVDSFTYTQKKNPEIDQKLITLQEQQKKLKAQKGPASDLVLKKGKEINELRALLREQEQENVSKACIVTTTVSKLTADKLFQNMMYDVVMFDEASMAYVTQVAAASTWCREHFICVGDFMQLSPIAQSSAKNILCNDIFSHLKINRYGNPFYHPWLVMLDEQRRMHPAISAFASEYIYHNLLKDHSSTRTSRNDIVRKKLFPEDAIILIDLIGTCCAAGKNADNSRYNILSGLIAFSCAVSTEKNIKSVSIITPYAAQTRLIRALILDYRQNKKKTDIRCATVHQFQGSESDVIIFDAVESFPSQKPGWLMGKDFNEIMRLINVAVTRAKGKLITIANDGFWTGIYSGTNHTLFRLLRFLKTDGTIISQKDSSLQELINDISLPGGPQFYSSSDEYLNQLSMDFSTAQVRILISMPSGKIEPTTAKRIQKALDKASFRGVSIEIKCKEYSLLPEAWKKYTIGTDSASFPLLLIDNSITWYGVPTAEWEYKDSTKSYKTIYPIACRIKGKHTTEMIRSLTEIDKKTTTLSSSMTPDTGNKSSKKLQGFPLYIKEHKKCPICKKPMSFARGKTSGKAIQWCKDCKRPNLITKDDVNHYILVNHVTCPRHNTPVEPKLGSYGMYIHCECGHNLKLEEI